MNRKATIKETVDKVLAILIEAHPLAFFPKDSEDTQPLMRGIHHVVKFYHPEIAWSDLNNFFRIYTSKRRYLRAVIEKTHRVNLAGLPVEKLPEKHKKKAADEIARREESVTM